MNNGNDFKFAKHNQMDHSSYRLNFGLDKKSEIYYHTRKSVLKLVKLQRLVDVL